MATIEQYTDFVRFVFSANHGPGAPIVWFNKCRIIFDLIGKSEKMIHTVINNMMPFSRSLVAISDNFGSLTSLLLWCRIDLCASARYVNYFMATDAFKTQQRMNAKRDSNCGIMLIKNAQPEHFKIVIPQRETYYNWSFPKNLDIDKVKSDLTKLLGIQF